MGQNNSSDSERRIERRHELLQDLKRIIRGLDPDPVKYRVAQKYIYTLAAVRRLRQCLDADGGHFDSVWILMVATSTVFGF